ncbi:MAG: hypothetical protein Q8L98_07590 [Chlamydiales bacterium]|nr:hypothetical protein [Chlamydiales bacterium]
MKSKMFAVLMVLASLFSSSQLQAVSFPSPEEESMDQFLVTAGTTGYILWQALELAKENGYRYVKILSAEYAWGNQVGSFTCPRDGDDTGKLISFEDETIRMVISCCSVEPADPDYIDVELYEGLFEFFDEEDEDGDDWFFDFDFDED